MGFWFNDYSAFEQKQSVDNRLVMGFTYVPDIDEGVNPKKVKVLVDEDIVIPSRIMRADTAKKVKAKVVKKEALQGYPLTEREVMNGRYRVLELEVPYNRPLIKSIPGEFQKGSYDKLYRFRHHPERKVRQGTNLEGILQGSESGEVHLENIDYEDFGEFPSLEEWKNMPYVVIDIEKPLWKTDYEKRKIKLLKRLEKEKKGYERRLKKSPGEVGENEGARISKRDKLVEKLRENLTIFVEGVGEVPLYEPQFRSDISFVTTIWGQGEGSQEKEIYMIDPNGECEVEEYGNYDIPYKIRRFGTEEELMAGLTEEFHKRNPVISFGHNEAYDITQLRFAGEEHKQKFDPGVKGVKPRRDFVINFLQRMKQDMVYVDTMWLANTFFPHLRQKRFGTNLKLSSVAKHMGLEFKKSMTHEELRFAELRRIAGETKEIRDRGLEEMLYYSADDVEVTKDLIFKMDFWPVLYAMKKAVPSSTMSRLAFSTNSVMELPELKHFRACGNLQSHGFEDKDRLDDLEYFKGRFAKLKEGMVKWARKKEGIEQARKGTYSGVQEYYVPLEKWLQDAIFNFTPEIADANEATKENPIHHAAYLQYLSKLSRGILSDYYFARKEEKAWWQMRKVVDKKPELLSEGSDVLVETADEQLLWQLVRHLDNSRKFFRRVASELDRKGKKTLRQEVFAPTLFDMGPEVPEIMAADSKLFLLSEHQREISRGLSEQGRRNLGNFSSQFEKFLDVAQTLPGGLDAAYHFAQRKILMRSERRFFAKYGLEIRDVTRKMAEGYREMVGQIKKSKSRLLENRGNYVFIQGSKEEDLPSLLRVREIEDFELGKVHETPMF